MTKYPETMTITVTKNDIATGHKDHPTTCAVANAIFNKCGIVARVSHITAFIGGKEYSLPSKAVKFILAFDNGKKVKPITFRMRRKR